MYAHIFIRITTSIGQLTCLANSLICANSEVKCFAYWQHPRVLAHYCTIVLQSREREKSLRGQLKESKELVATTTNTANGLKMMLKNKDEIMSLNKTWVRP